MNLPGPAVRTPVRSERPGLAAVPADGHCPSEHEETEQGRGGVDLENSVHEYLLKGHYFDKWAESYLEIQAERLRGNDSVATVTPSATASLQAKQRAYLMEATPEPAPPAQPSRTDESTQVAKTCSICLRTNAIEILLVCAGCNIPVHPHCYGVTSILAADWLCRRCVQTSPARRSYSDSLERCRRLPSARELFGSPVKHPSANSSISPVRSVAPLSTEHTKSAGVESGTPLADGEADIEHRPLRSPFPGSSTRPTNSYLPARTTYMQFDALLSEVVRPQFEQLLAVEASIRGPHTNVVGRVAFNRVAASMQPQLRPLSAGALWKQALIEQSDAEVLDWPLFEKWLKRCWGQVCSRLNSNVVVAIDDDEADDAAGDESDGEGEEGKTNWASKAQAATRGGYTPKYGPDSPSKKPFESAEMLQRMAEKAIE